MLNSIRNVKNEVDKNAKTHKNFYHRCLCFICVLEIFRRAPPSLIEGSTPPGLSVQMRAQLIILISCQIMSKLASLKNRLRIDYLTFTRKLMRFPAWLQMPVKIWSILFSIRGCKFCSKMQVLPWQVLRCLKYYILFEYLSTELWLFKLPSVGENKRINRQSN